MILFIFLAVFVFIIPFEESLIRVSDFVPFMKILGAILVFFYLLNNLFRKRRLSFQTIPDGKILLILSALMLLSTAFSFDKKASLTDYFTYLQLFMFYLIVVHCLDKEKKVQFLLVVLVLAGVANAAYAIHNFFAEGTIFGSSSSRQAGFLDNANRFGYMQGLIFLLGFPLLLSIRKKLIRFTAISVLGVIFFSAFLSFSRGFFVALVVTLLYSLTYVLKQKTMVFVLVLLVTLTGVMIPSVFWSRIETIYHDDPIERGLSRIERSILLKEGFLMGIENPLIGVGLGNFGEALGRSGSAFWMTGDYRSAHNMYIAVMAECGIFALTVFLALLYRCYRRIVTCRNSRRRTLVNYAIGVELAMVFSLVAGLFGTIEYSKILWFLLALIGALGRINMASEARAYSYRRE